MSATTLKFVARMWGVLLLIFIVLPCVAGEERVPDGDFTDNEKTVISRLIKRLEKSSESSQLQRVQPKDGDRHREDKARLEPQCDGNVNIDNGTIIKTEDSLAKGARFLNVVKGVASNGECVDHCCKNSSCDTAVYENKEKHFCYLFNCQRGCMFSKLGTFITSTVNRSALSTPSSAPATDDKQTVGSDLGTDFEHSDLDTDGGENEGGDVTGDDSATDGSAGQGPVKLKEEKTTTASPTTTTSADVSTTTTTSTVSTAAPSHILPHSVTLGGVCYDDLHCKDPMAECSFQHCVCPQGFRQQGDVCHKEKQTDSTQSSADKEQVESDLNINEGNQTEDQHSLEEEGQQEEAKEEQQEETQHNSKEENKTTLSKDAQKDNPVSSDEKDIDSTQPPEDIADAEVAPSTTTPHSPFISREKVEQGVEETSLQVPIIALSLGLSFTLILLLFVACRLCRVRRQLRKSRPLHCNEADYLINGMYL